MLQPFLAAFLIPLSTALTFACGIQPERNTVCSVLANDVRTFSSNSSMRKRVQSEHSSPALLLKYICNSAVQDCCFFRNPATFSSIFCMASDFPLLMTGKSASVQDTVSSIEAILVESRFINNSIMGEFCSTVSSSPT